MHREQRPDQVRPVGLGVGVAILIAVAMAGACDPVIRQYDGSGVQTAPDGTTYLIATGILMAMSFYMQ